MLGSHRLWAIPTFPPFAKGGEGGFGNERVSGESVPTAIVQPSPSIHFGAEDQRNVNRKRRLPSQGIRGSTPAFSSLVSRLVRIAAAAASCSNPERLTSMRLPR